MSNKNKMILDEFTESYEQSMMSLNSFIAEAYTDLKFFVGDQWDAKSKAKLKREGRNAYVFNRLRVIIKMITGYQRRNRLSSVCEPVEGSDQATAQLLSDVLLWEMQRKRGYNILSDAFQGALITGFNMLTVWMDYTKDFVNGDIRISREPFNSFIFDPYFTNLDLSDCRYVIRRRYVTREEARALLPGQSKDIDMIREGQIDSKFSYLPYARNDNGANLLAYDEFWKRTSLKKKLLIDSITGETKIWDGTAEELSAYRDQFPWVNVKTVFVPAIERHIILQGEVMRSDVNPDGIDDYPFIPVVCFFNSEYDDYAYKIQGVVRALRDPQEEYNKRRSKIVDILDRQVNSGWIVKEGSVKNKKDLYKTGQGIVIERTIDSQPTDVTKIQPSEASASDFQLIQMLNKELIEISGANEELLGVADTGNTEVSGTLAKSRADNGLTTLQDMFDNLAYSQKLLGQKIIKLAQANYNAEKIQRITEKEPTPEFFDQEFGKYDCVIKETMLTDTQRRLAYAQAIQAKSVGINIPESFIIDTMPVANREELNAAYDEEKQRMEEMQAKQAEQEEIAARLANAETIHRLALAKEEEKRAVANEGLARERISESVQNRSQAVLDMVKAAAEIQGMEQDQLMNSVNFLFSLQQAAKATSQETQVEQAGDEASASIENTYESIGLSADQQGADVVQPI